MKSHAVFQAELQDIIVDNPSQKLFDYIEENIMCFFSTPFISDYYKILKDTDISASQDILPKLIKAWLAFLCGDNAGLHSIMRHIDELALVNPQESSFYYALKAIMGLSSGHQEELKYAKLSIDVLPEGDCSIFMANAKLTYAQILSGLDQYRTAIELFDDSYRLFYAQDVHFPAVVALVNKLLNEYHLGEFSTVIDECNSTLIMSGSFRELQSDIERFELEYIKGGKKSPLILVETLAYLKLKGFSDAITLEDIAASLEKLRFTGTIPYIQLFLIFLAEMHFMENRQKNAAELLKEAASIYREYGISSGFYMLPLKSIHLLQKANQKLYNEIIKKVHVDKAPDTVSILSAREKEIMQLVAQGKGNEEIGKTLFISVGTIKWHINHIFAKLEVNNRMMAAEKAKSLGEI